MCYHLPATTLKVENQWICNALKSKNNRHKKLIKFKKNQIQLWNLYIYCSAQNVIYYKEWNIIFHIMESKDTSFNENFCNFC